MGFCGCQMALLWWNLMHLFFCKHLRLWLPNCPILVKGIWDFYQIIYCERCDKPQKHGIRCEWKEKREGQGQEELQQDTSIFRLEARNSTTFIEMSPANQSCRDCSAEDVFRRKLVFSLKASRSILNEISTEKSSKHCLGHQSSIHHRQANVKAKENKKKTISLRPARWVPEDFVRQPAISNTSSACHN